MNGVKPLWVGTVTKWCQPMGNTSYTNAQIPIYSNTNIQIWISIGSTRHKMVLAHGKGPNSMDSSEIRMKNTFLPNVITWVRWLWDNDCDDWEREDNDCGDCGIMIVWGDGCEYSCGFTDGLMAWLHTRITPGNGAHADHWCIHSAHYVQSVDLGIIGAHYKVYTNRHHRCTLHT